MSVIFDILTEAKTRLEEISIDNGYQTDVFEVVLPQHSVNSYTPEDYQIIVLAGDPIRVPDHDRHGNPPAIGYALPIRVNCIVLPSEADDEAYDMITTRFAEDAIRAITSVPDWQRFDGNCVNAEVGPIVPYRPDDLSPGGIKFQINAFYRVSETNPSLVRA